MARAPGVLAAAINAARGKPMIKQTCGLIHALVIASLMVPAVALAFF
jgi:hypothetical protein